MASRPNLRLQAARKSAGLTQVQLSERSGLSQRLVSSLETGTRHGSIETLNRLARVLGVSVSYLLGEKVTDDKTAVPREKILKDPSAAPDLVALARNLELCHALEIEPDEWAFLRALNPPYALTREAYLAILQVARTCRQGR